VSLPRLQVTAGAEANGRDRPIAARRLL